MIGDSSFRRPIHTPKPGRQPSARDSEILQRAVFGARGRGGIRVYIDLDGMVIDGSLAGGASLKKWAFGWKSTSGQTVTIDAGYVEGRYGYRAVAETVVNVGGNATNKHLIIATGNDTSASVETNSVLESAFNGDTANQWRRTLYRVYLDNGKPVMDMICAGVGGIVQ